MPDHRVDHLTAIASEERESAREFAEEMLPADARVSVYLFQPVQADGLRDSSPGTLFDVGPVPDALSAIDRSMLFQCAEAGRTGSFLQSASDCTRRVPQTTEIDRAAYDSYRAFNGCAGARRAQIAVEASRYDFEPQTDDGPPMGWHIHHLALAPHVHAFHALHTGRIPVLGTVFTVTKEPKPVARHEYSNLVDYAIFIAEEVLEIRATHLLGGGHLGATYAGSALEKLLEDPTCDDALQFVVKLLFAHHWFFPYDAVAHALLRRCAGGDDAASQNYARHGWSPPRQTEPIVHDDTTLQQLVILASVLLHTKDYAAALEQLEAALRLAPTYAEAHLTLGILWRDRADYDASLRELHEALRSTPTSPRVHLQLGKTLLARGDARAGIDALRRARALAPSDGIIATELAWHLATAPDLSAADRAEALRLARGLATTGGKDSPQVLDALAAALAANGRLPDAIAASERAIAIARSQGPNELVTRLSRRLGAYRRGEPYVASPGESGP